MQRLLIRIVILLLIPLSFVGLGDRGRVKVGEFRDVWSWNQNISDARSTERPRSRAEDQSTHHPKRSSFSYSHPSSTLGIRRLLAHLPRRR